MRGEGQREERAKRRDLTLFFFLVLSSLPIFFRYVKCMRRFSFDWMSFSCTEPLLHMRVFFATTGLRRVLCRGGEAGAVPWLELSNNKKSGRFSFLLLLGCVCNNNCPRPSKECQIYQFSCSSPLTLPPLSLSQFISGLNN